MSVATEQMVQDRAFMQAALNFGQRFIGQTAPNPSVGSLVVRDGVIVGQGATQKGGRPHAETEALRQAGALAQRATLYVTLEPCSHHGVTAPCVEAIVAAGIKRVVVALQDPDPRVAGRGYEVLRAAGIEVVTDVCEAQARRAHRGHILRITQGRPMLTLKLAQTADGYVADHAPAPRLMITGATSSSYVHQMRAEHDAIMVGIGTILADDPLLTVRLDGVSHRPLRIVLDSDLRMSDRSQIVRTASEYPTLILCGVGADAQRMTHLISCGVDVAEVMRDENQRLDLSHVMRHLAQRGVTRVLCEGGPCLANALLRADLVDDVVMFTAPTPLGHEGVRALSAPAQARLADRHIFQLLSHFVLRVDMLDHYERL